jgi:hypothetical protein
MNAPLTARRATAIAKAAVPGVRFRSETRAAGVIRVTLIESLDAGRDLRAAQAAFLQSGYEVGMVLGAGALYVTEAEPVEIEQAEPERIIHDGDTEESCRHCRYFTGHTSWCPNAAPALPEIQPVYTESGEYLGEIRQEETGARYWTAAEIAELRDREAAERALVEFGLSSEEARAEVAEVAEELAADDAAEVAAYLAGAQHVADRRAAEPEWHRLGYVDEAAYLDAPGRLTPAGILAAATGHPSGQVIRSTYRA